MLVLKLLFLLLIYNRINCETIFCNLGKKVLNQVSDKFIGISVDPAILLSSFNISDTSGKMAKFMGPAFLRLAGPTTEYIQYSVDERNASDVESGLPPKSLIITPSSWAASNAWLSSSNLTLVFALNDHDRVNGEWNPKSMFPLFDLSDKLNIACHFQLGFDSSNKTLDQYKNDLMTLRHVLDAFPESKTHWNIIGSDISKLPLLTVDERFPLTEELTDVVNAIMWESTDVDGLEYPIKDNPRFRNRKQLVPFWLATPKQVYPTTFCSALDWAVQLGDAAARGFKVVFRQPRLFAIISETPVFWTSVLHKTLMGRNVLDIKVNNIYLDKLHVYAHCTKMQNSYTKSGAVTIFVVNKYDEDQEIAVKIPGPLKAFEVQSYVLTASACNSTWTYCNDKKLDLKEINDPLKMCVPKLRRAQVPKNLILTVPPKSIGFYVLPGVRFSTCIDKENETNLLMDELLKDQKISFSNEEPTESSTEMPFQNPSNLKEIYEKLKYEVKQDEAYYNKMATMEPKLQLRNSNDNNNKINDTLKALRLPQIMENTRVFRSDFKAPSIRNLLKKSDWEYLNGLVVNRNLDPLFGKYFEIGSRKKRGILEKIKEVSLFDKFRKVPAVEKNFMDKINQMRSAQKARAADFLQKLKNKRKFRKTRAINMDLIQEKTKKFQSKPRLMKVRDNDDDEEGHVDPTKEIKKIYDDIAKFVENSRKQAEQSWNTLVHPPKSKDNPLIVSPSDDDATVEDISDEEMNLEAVGEENPNMANFQRMQTNKPELFARRKSDYDTLLADDVPTYYVGPGEEIAKSIQNLEEYFKSAQRLENIMQQSMDDHYGIFNSLEQGAHHLRYKRGNADIHTLDKLISDLIQLDDNDEDKTTNNKDKYEYLLLGESLDPLYFKHLNDKIKLIYPHALEHNHNNLDEIEDNDNGNDKIVKRFAPLLRKKRDLCDVIVKEDKLLRRDKKSARRPAARRFRGRLSVGNRGSNKNEKIRNRRNVYDNYIRSKEENDDFENKIPKFHVKKYPVIKELKTTTHSSTTNKNVETTESIETTLDDSTTVSIGSTTEVIDEDTTITGVKVELIEPNLVDQVLNYVKGLFNNVKTKLSKYLDA